MLELGEVLDLADEPFSGGGIVEVDAKCLYRNFAVVLDVVRKVDARHGSVAEHALGDVAADEGDTELLEHEIFQRGHGPEYVPNVWVATLGGQ